MQPSPWPLVAALLVFPQTAGAQTLNCINPATMTPLEDCRISADGGVQRVLVVLQLLAADGQPIRNQTVQLVWPEGNFQSAATTDHLGMVKEVWVGNVGSDSILLSAAVNFDGGRVVRREVRIGPSTPTSVAYIVSVAPKGDHSAFAGKYLDGDIVVALAADGATCARTSVVFELMNGGTSDQPAARQAVVPALWSQLGNDTTRSGCSAHFRWLLSSAVGDQRLRTWVQRDSTFELPETGGPERYLRPHQVRATAHAQPAFLVGAAVIDSTVGIAVPKLVGLDFSLPRISNFVKRNVNGQLGGALDRVRLFAATEFGQDLGRTAYFGIEPLVFVFGPRIADLPIALAAGVRTGKGDNQWFVAGLMNAAQVAGALIEGFGLGGEG